MNLHAFRHWILSPARLPIPPLSQSLIANSSVDSGCSDTGDRCKLPYPPAAAIGFARSAAMRVKGHFAVVNRSCLLPHNSLEAAACHSSGSPDRTKTPLRMALPSVDSFLAADNGHWALAPKKSSLAKNGFLPDNLG